VIARIKEAVLDRLGINRLARTDDQLGADVAGLQNQLAGISVQGSETTARFEERLERLELAQRVSATTAWAATAPLRHQPTISVVMATRDRSQLVGTAIDSIVSQTYPHWQLVVVDDGSKDQTTDVLARAAEGDQRVQLAFTSGVGAAGARNVGLAAATGNWIAFVDDDNTMAPGWLRAVAEYTGRATDCLSLYGAGLREDHVDVADVPRVLFTPIVDVDRLRSVNSIDLGTLAVRAEHPELNFDESLDRFIDWEMIVRLAAHGSMHPVPVLASAYSIQADRRISAPEDGQQLAAMQRRLGGTVSPAD